MKLIDVYRMVMDFFRGKASGETIKNLESALSRPMPGHEEMTIGEYYFEEMKKKGVKLK